MVDGAETVERVYRLSMMLKYVYAAARSLSRLPKRSIPVAVCVTFAIFVASLFSAVGVPGFEGARVTGEGDLLVFIGLFVILMCATLTIYSKNVFRMSASDTKAISRLFRAVVYPSKGFRVYGLSLVRASLILMGGFTVAAMSYVLAAGEAGQNGLMAVVAYSIPPIYVLLVDASRNLDILGGGRLERLWAYIKSLPFRLLIVVIAVAEFLLLQGLGPVMFSSSPYGHSYMYLVVAMAATVLATYAIYYLYWSELMVAFRSIESILSNELRIRFRSTGYVGEGSEEQEYSLMDYIVTRLKMSYYFKAGPGRDGGSEGHGRRVGHVYRRFAILFLIYNFWIFVNMLKDEVMGGGSGKGSKGLRRKCIYLTFWRTLNEVTQLNLTPLDAPDTGPGSGSGGLRRSLREVCFKDTGIGLSPTYSYGRIPIELVRWLDDMVQRRVELVVSGEAGR